MNISFIGYGAMAKAIARGLMKQGHHSLSASSPSLTQGTNKEGIKTWSDNKKAIKDATIIILAVKPMQMSVILEEIVPCLSPDCLLISVAAGLSLSWFARYCDEKVALIRTMPNTPASEGLAATPMIANLAATEAHKQVAELIFSSIGLTTWVHNEEEMDTFTALSGSGPAYVFLFLESMIQAGVALGLDESIAKTFTLQTVMGALKLVQNSELSLKQLRTHVTSPNGTTAAAIKVLEPQLNDLIYNAIKAAKLRSRELGSN